MTRFPKRDREVTTGELIDPCSKGPASHKARASRWANPIRFKKAARQFWNAMQEDGENFDYETCVERLKEFVATLTE